MGGEEEKGVSGRCPHREVIDHREVYVCQLRCLESELWRMVCRHGLDVDF